MAEPVDNLPPHDRRRFFSAGLSRLLQPLTHYVEGKLPFALPQLRTVLRPPGAIPEKQFVETCLRCGACVDACPAHAIVPSPRERPRDGGTPFVDPEKAACVICDELACMKACPSGALELVDRLDIRMGLARWRENHCLRSNGEDCTICIDKCPLGATAIRLDNGRVAVIAPNDSDEHGMGRGCTGCGICQLYCPTHPKAIIVEPA